MKFPMLDAANHALLETLLQQWLQHDARSQQQLALMPDGVIRLPQQQLDLLVAEGKVHLSGIDEMSTADLVIDGDRADWLQWWQQGRPNSDWTPLQTQGEPLYLLGLAQFLSQVEYDWEDALANLTGGIAAHAIGSGWRSLSDWHQQSQDNITQIVSEYIQEELHLVPGRTEVQHFFDDVDALQKRTEQLEQQLQTLLKSKSAQ